MTRFYFYTGLLILTYAGTIQASFTPPSNRTFASLPLYTRETRFEDIQKAVEERSTLFLRGRQFQAWKPNKSSEEIQKEFDHIQEWRYHSWYSDITNEYLMSRPDFIIAQELLRNGRYRRPHLIAFEYNVTDPSYNSSTIVLQGQHFLALEAPREDLVTDFFKLLQNQLVTQLVRLTPASENGREKSFPYWQGNTSIDAKAQTQWLHLPRTFKSEGKEDSYTIRYYTIEDWADNRGVDPKVLLKTIQDVRKDYDPKGLLACHCSAGVGRTGTFIAGFLLVQEIDRQIASGKKPDQLDISIEKMVMQLSLQRPHLVAKNSQYETLYRLVDLYVNQLKTKKTN